MPRQSSSTSQNRSSPSSPKVYAPPPKIWYATPPPSILPQLPSSTPTLPQPTLWQSMKQGIGFGAGSEVGHRVIGNILGSPTSSSLPPPALPPQNIYYASEQYKQCLEYNQHKKEVCTPLLSKDKSPWTQCMEMNFYRSELCTGETK